MTRGLRFAGLVALSLACATGAGVTGADAQTSNDDLRIRQEALFEAMLNAPDNLDIMFEHALTSIALKDYEAAISTLERMLIFNPDLARAKVELGAAYFRLGAYENARFYFEDVLERDNPPPEVEKRVIAFLDEIGKRTQTSGFVGRATAGVTYSSNANLGPPNENVLVGGQGAILPEQFVESDDVGFRATLSGRHFYDLEQPDGDVWLTDISAFSLHYLDETQGDIDSVTVRSGPRLSLSNSTFGPRIRPFVEADFVSAGNDPLFATFGVGAEYTDNLTEQVTLFASAKSAYREYFERSFTGFDAHTHRVNLGLSYNPDPSMTLTGLIFAETDQADSDFNTNYETGLRLSGTYRYDSGLEISDRLWSVSGFVGATYRGFEEPRVDITDAVTREDVDLRAGVSHVFQLTGGWYVQADADFLLRESDIPNFDIDSFGVALSVGRSF
ncbi:MAG: tetratricopeptide repeat protein [Pseudomonadota bacterium]